MRMIPCKVHESFLVGDVKFTVLQIKGDRIRFRVDAPLDIAVHRGEVIQELSEAAQRALTAPLSAPRGP
jgi:carbon storage regulator CsrA